MNIEFEFCDYKNPEHRQNLKMLLNLYMADPMGGVIPHSNESAEELVNGLAAHSESFVLFAKADKQYIGLLTCFINFSTFKAKPYLNIHDVIVVKEFRGKHIGRKLLEKSIEIARERGYCKITLEVRDDNTAAKNLYQSLDFNECTPFMHFWTKTL
jgi:ribosomal protein S18 acetylase RimI-like enzyme